MPEKTLSRSDVDSLGSKLEAFAEGLPEQERNVLAWLMARARNASAAEISEEDLEAVSGGLAEALDMAADDTIEVSVGWAK